MNVSEILASAMQFHRSGDLLHAEKIYRSIIRESPDCGDAFHLLGVLVRQRGDEREATRLLKKACDLRPDSELFLVDCANCLYDQRALSDALAYYQRALACAPETIVTHLKIADCFRFQGDFQSSRGHLMKVIELKPDSFEALCNLAELDRLQGDHAGALSFMEKALQIRPDCAAAYNGAGRLCETLGETEKALHFYREAVSLDDGFAEAYDNIGSVLCATGDFNAAIAAYKQAMKIRPDFFEPYYNLGNCLRETNNCDEAILCFRAALQVKPSSLEALTNCGETLQTIGDCFEAEKCFRKAVEISNGSCAPAYSNLLLCLNYNPDYSPPRLFDEHLGFGIVFDDHSKQPTVADKKSNALQKLRVGYVSPDLCDHPVARFIEPILTHHDHTAFDIVCYSDVAKPDATSKRLYKTPLLWRDVFGMADEALTRLIRDDRIDILVDCAGHTARNRLLVFARKPAAVQVSYCGYPNTTGLTAMDYVLTDAVLDPPEDAPLFIEKLLRLDGCFCCFLPPRGAPAVSDLPAAKRGYITFGSLHPLARLNEKVIECWCGILHDVPLSRLFIARTTLAGAAKKRLVNLISHYGVDLKRVELRHEIPASGHLSLFHEIDMTLDTFPWSGHTTACESLWMGVPVITLHGNRHAGRMASSIEKSIGMEDWVAGSLDHYRALAIKKAFALDELGALRHRLRTVMAGSNVCNANDFVKKLEAAYRKMWDSRDMA